MEIIVKNIVLKAIDSKSANNFVKKWHYSGKIVNNSQLHFGCFYNEKLYGVLSYGPSLNKNGMINLVKNTGWSEFIELNRMAFDDCLPKNSESYCISQSIKLIKKYCPQIKWIVSFADATQCGHGTIYQASNFLLTGLKQCKDSYILPNNESYTLLTSKLHGYTKALKPFITKTDYNIITMGSNSINKLTKIMKIIKAKINIGYQIRYIYFIDRKKIKDLTVPILNYSEIEKHGARMYKGLKISK